MLGRVHFGGRDQTVEIESELIVQAVLDGAAKNAGENEPADDEAKDAPNRGAGDQPEGERIRSWKCAVQLSTPPALGSSSL